MFVIQFHSQVSRGPIKLTKTNFEELAPKLDKKKNEDVKETECNFCKYKGRKLKEHINTNHGTEVSVTGLKHNGLLYICVHCGFECKQKYGIVTHVDRIHDQTRFPCEKCPYVSNSRPNLARHKKKEHQKEVKNPCSLCGFQSMKVEHLQRHMSRV